MYFVFSQAAHGAGAPAIAGRPARCARPTRAAASIAAATGMPTATAAGGAEPLAERGAPPPVGVRTEDAVSRRRGRLLQEAKDAADRG